MQPPKHKCDLIMEKGKDPHQSQQGNSASYLLVSVLCGINVILQELGLDLQLQVAQQSFISFLQRRDIWLEWQTHSSPTGTA